MTAAHRVLAPLLAGMAKVAALGVAFILCVCVVLAVLGAVWTVLDAVAMLMFN